jgi:hypothetical protein
VAKLLLYLNGKRALVLAIAAIAAVLNAKGHAFKPLGFFDGPH